MHTLILSLQGHELRSLLMHLRIHVRPQCSTLARGLGTDRHQGWSMQDRKRTLMAAVAGAPEQAGVKARCAAGAGLPAPPKIGAPDPLLWIPCPCRPLLHCASPPASCLHSITARSVNRAVAKHLYSLQATHRDSFTAAGQSCMQEMELVRGHHVLHMPHFLSC